MTEWKPPADCSLNDEELAYAKNLRAFLFEQDNALKEQFPDPLEKPSTDSAKEAPWAGRYVLYRSFSQAKKEVTTAFATEEGKKAWFDKDKKVDKCYTKDVRKAIKETRETLRDEFVELEKTLAEHYGDKEKATDSCNRIFRAVNPFSESCAGVDMTGGFEKARKTFDFG